MDNVEVSADIDPSEDCGCSGAGGNPAEGTGGAASPEMGSGGFSGGMVVGAAIVNGPVAATGGLSGTNSVQTGAPVLVQTGDNYLVAVEGANQTHWFTQSGSPTSPTISSIFAPTETLSYVAISGGGHEYVMNEDDGSLLYFYDFDSSVDSKLRGHVKKLVAPGGAETLYSYYTDSGDPAAAQGKLKRTERSSTTSGVTTTERFDYSYGSTGGGSGLVQSISLSRAVSNVNSGTFSTIQSLNNSYDSNGDLVTSNLEDSGTNLVDGSYYRYYSGTSASEGRGRLKYAFGPAAFERLKAAYPSYDTATDAQVAAYADLYFAYDAIGRITTKTAAGEGCSTCSGGQGTYTYTYERSAFAPGPNVWSYKSIETRPDTSQLITYANAAGQTMLEVLKVGSDEWRTCHQYDLAYREVLTAGPTTVTGYDDTTEDLIDSGSYLSTVTVYRPADFPRRAISLRVLHLLVPWTAAS